MGTFHGMLLLKDNGENRRHGLGPLDFTGPFEHVTVQIAVRIDSCDQDPRKLFKSSPPMRSRVYVQVHGSETGESC
jgi:hypothetical protein